MLIVDGYNVLMQMALKEQTLEGKRKHFLSILNKRHRIFGGVMVVFDGKEEVDDFYRRENLDIRVVYTKNESADDYIKSTIEKSKNPKTIVLATDDRELKDFARMHECQLIASQDLIHKISPPKRIIPRAAENKEVFVDSEKAKTITDELKKKWQ